MQMHHAILHLLNLKKKIIVYLDESEYSVDLIIFVTKFFIQDGVATILFDLGEILPTINIPSFLCY